MKEQVRAHVQRVKRWYRRSAIELLCLYGRRGPGFRSHEIYRRLGPHVGAVRLKLRVDTEGIANEIKELVGEPRNLTQADVNSIFLRPAGNQRLHQARSTYSDTSILSGRPILRQTLHSALPAEPRTALLASLKPQGIVTVHSDEFRYFSSTIRIHIPIITSPSARTWCHGKAYDMKAGDVWALNNMALHGALNSSESESRWHIICDYVPSDELIELITNGEANLGYDDPELEEAVFSETGRRFSPAIRAKYERRLQRETA